MHQKRVAVAIDATDIDRPSGARTAVFDLLCELFRQAPGYDYHVLVSQLEPAFRISNVSQIVVPFRQRVLQRLWVQAIMLWLTVSRSVALVHYARTMGGFVWRVPSVLTIFDVTTLVHPELHSVTARWYWHYIVPIHLRMASRIIAISVNVADDLVRYFGVPEDKITVIYCAPQATFDRPATAAEILDVRLRYGLSEDYLLSVGILARKKNLAVLAETLALLAHQGIRPHLVMVGRSYSQSNDTAIFELISKLGLGDQVHYLGPVSSQTLKALYAGATMLVFPSLHEGFGIPCVEAMKSGVPILAAGSGAIPEVVGDAGLLVDASANASVWAESIRRLMCDERLRHELVERGYQRAQAFAWPRIVQQTLVVYEQLLEGKAGI